MLGKIEGKRKKQRQGKRWLDSVSKLWEILEDGGAWCATVHEVAELDTTYQLNNDSQNSIMYYRKEKKIVSYSFEFLHSFFQWLADNNDSIVIIVSIVNTITR